MHKLIFITALATAGSALAQVPAQTAALPPAIARGQAGTPPPAQPQATQITSAQPSEAFPPPPASAPGQPAVQQTHFGPSTYTATQGRTAPGPVAGHDGIAPLPPLAPPNNGKQGQDAVSPFTPAEIIQMRKHYDSTRKAKAHRPVRTVPRISSVTVDLSPGSALPITRMLPGEMSTLLFLDATGAPWPLAAPPRVSDNRYFDAEWLQGTATVVMSAMSPYEDGNITVLLQGFDTPIVIKLVTGEPDSKAKSRIVDYRLDLRIPGRAPGSPAGVIGPGKIALYDNTMQRFLDGIPPTLAKVVKIDGARSNRTQAWALDGALFVRTDLDIQTAFDQSIAAGDGTRVYRLPPTPFVTLSDGGRSVTLQLEID